TLVCASTLVLGSSRTILWLGGPPTRTRGSICEKRRPCRRPARAGAVDTFVLGLPIPSSAATACQQAPLPRAFAGSYPGHGACGGALAQVFAQTATLPLIIPPPTT